MTTWEEKWDMIERHVSTTKSEKITITIMTPKSKKRLAKKDIKEALLMAVDRLENSTGVYKVIGDGE